MSDPKRPSLIIETFVREAQRNFPSSESCKIEPHEVEIARTTTVQDGHRARICAHWAIDIADQKDSEHPRWSKIKEAHQLWKDSVFGLKFAFGEDRTDGAIGSIGDVEIQWVKDAVLVAQSLADEVGWANVPWEELLVSLIRA